MKVRNAHPFLSVGSVQSEAPSSTQTSADTTEAVSIGIRTGDGCWKLNGFEFHGWAESQSDTFSSLEH